MRATLIRTRLFQYMHDARGDGLVCETLCPPTLVWSIFEATLPRWKCEDCMTLQEAIATFGFEGRSKL